MEGDVIGGYLRWYIGIWLIGLLLAGLFFIGRGLAQRLLREMDTRFNRIDVLAAEVARVDSDLKRLIADLPMHYQRRDDAIREYTTINSKIDRVIEVLIDIRRGGARHE